VRVVNVTDLLVLAAQSRHPHALSDDLFGELFTPDKPVLFNYHGYASEVQGLLFGRPTLDRMQVNGYREEGSTTTPFDMLLRNGVDRFGVARRALRAAAEGSPALKDKLEETLGLIEARVEAVRRHIYTAGEGKHLALTSRRVLRGMALLTKSIADPDGTYDVPSFCRPSG